jgi:hypothetical protein
MILVNFYKIILTMGVLNKFAQRFLIIILIRIFHRLIEFSSHMKPTSSINKYFQIFENLFQKLN